MITELAARYQKTLSAFTPLAPCSDRTAWDSLGPGLAAKLLAQGETRLDFKFPALAATDYMEFCRTGNRSNFQAVYFKKRIVLNQLILAECVENKNRFLDPIINGLFSICEESAWQLPAHNSYIRDTPQLPLPDITRPVIDLFAAETGAVLSVAAYLLSDKLDAVSPAIRQMIRHRLYELILTPYLREHFWWMGDGHSQMNNWTVWCTQNVLLTAFCLPVDESLGQQIFHKASQSIDYFMAEYEDDGCCDEGPHYYRHAGLCLFGCLEVLNSISDGHFTNVYEQPKIKNIAAYILNVHVADNYYINFADCPARAGRCSAREFLFGQRTNQPPLMQFAASDFKADDDPLQSEEHNLYYRLLTIIHYQEMTAYPTDQPLIHPDIFYPSTGTFIARDDHLCLAVKAGDNGDSHNHNDTGSFTIYKDGQPLFIDVGVEVYTRKTFSPERYEIWTMQSQFHNLPSFGGCCQEDAGKFPYAYDTAADGEINAMQMNGSEYQATNVMQHISDTCCRISMELANSYPDAGVTSYQRTVSLEKGRQITVTDTFQGNRKPVILSLMTWHEPVWNADTATLSIGNLGTCQITGAKQIRNETIMIQDENLKNSWGKAVYRTLVSFAANNLELTIS